MILFFADIDPELQALATPLIEELARRRSSQPHNPRTNDDIVSAGRAICGEILDAVDANGHSGCKLCEA